MCFFIILIVNGGLVCNRANRDQQIHWKRVPVNSMEGPRGPDKVTGDIVMICLMMFYDANLCDVWFGKAVQHVTEVVSPCLPVLGPERMVASWQSLSKLGKVRTFHF